MLYELATGERPFTGDTGVAVLSSIIKDTPAICTNILDFTARVFVDPRHGATNGQ
jgi:hypothetical protein